MRRKFVVPQWIPTAILILFVPVIGYLVVSNIEDTRHSQEQGAQTETEANMLAYMHQQYDAEHRRAGFHWAIQRRNDTNTMVCYCDKKGYGWWYEVQTSPDGQFTASQVADTSAASTQSTAAFPTAIP